MRLPLANCPVCNAVQTFARRERQSGSRIEVYTRCLTCKSEFVLDSFSVEEKRQRARVERDRRRAIRSDFRQSHRRRS